jgi:hypothetical protein
VIKEGFTVFDYVGSPTDAGDVSNPENVQKSNSSEKKMKSKSMGCSFPQEFEKDIEL